MFSKCLLSNRRLLKDLLTSQKSCRFRLTLKSTSAILLFWNAGPRTATIYECCSAWYLPLLASCRRSLRSFCLGCGDASTMTVPACFSTLGTGMPHLEKCSPSLDKYRSASTRLLWRPTVPPPGAGIRTVTLHAQRRQNVIKTKLF